MEDTRYDILLEENINCKKALAAAKHTIERTVNDLETLKQIHEDLKKQMDKLKREKEDLAHKYTSAMAEKKEIEVNFDASLRNFKMAIEQKQKELEEVQMKMIPSLDHDMIRIKIINELEMPHRQQIEAKDQEINKLQNQIYELKRQLDLSNTKLDGLKFESEKDIRMLKDRHQMEINELMSEIQMLQEKVDDIKDKDIIRNLKKQLDEIKYKYDESELEIEELRREKEKFRDEKNEVLQKLNRQLDNEKSERRHLKSECDKANIKIKQLENELILLSTKLQDKDQMAAKLQKELEKNLDLLEQRNKHIANLQNHINELEEGQHTAQTKLQEFITQTQLQGHEKTLTEKNRIATLQRELETYQKQILDLENRNRTINFQVTRDLEAERLENQKLSDANKHLQKNLDEKENEIRAMKRECESLREEIDATQKRLKDYASKEIQNKVTVAEPNKTESAALIEAKRHEDALKNKVARLKAKLKKANAKIMELLTLKIASTKDYQEPEIAIPPVATTTAFNPVYAKIDNSFSITNKDKDIVEDLRRKYGITDDFADDLKLDNELRKTKFGRSDYASFENIPTANRRIISTIDRPVRDITKLSRKYDNNGIIDKDFLAKRNELVDRYMNKYSTVTDIDRISLPKTGGEMSFDIKGDISGVTGKQASDESLIHDEISRIAEKGLHKYSINPIA